MSLLPITRPIYRWVRYLCNVLLAIQVVLVCYIVFTRFVLNDSPPWGEELALLLMVWFCLLSPPEAIHENRHLAITLIEKVLPGQALKAVDVFNHLLILVFAGFMAIEGYRLTMLTARNILPGMGVPASYLYASVPVAGVLLAIASIDRIVEILSIPGRDYRPTESKD
jgi:TRAP-type C4-dicarboxylate transport system permease small subunit